MIDKWSENQGNQRIVVLLRLWAANLIRIITRMLRFVRLYSFIVLSNEIALRRPVTPHIWEKEYICFDLLSVTICCPMSAAVNLQNKGGPLQKITREQWIVNLYAYCNKSIFPKINHPHNKKPRYLNCCYIRILYSLLSCEN
jgi:hypothetical protein